MNTVDETVNVIVNVIKKHKLNGYLQYPKVNTSLLQSTLTLHLQYNQICSEKFKN